MNDMENCEFKIPKLKSELSINENFCLRFENDPPKLVVETLAMGVFGFCVAQI